MRYQFFTLHSDNAVRSAFTTTAGLLVFRCHQAVVRLQRGGRFVGVTELGTYRDRLYERHTQVHQFTVKIPALREPTGDVRRHQRLSR